MNMKKICAHKIIKLFRWIYFNKNYFYCDLNILIERTLELIKNQETNRVEKNVGYNTYLDKQIYGT